MGQDAQQVFEQGDVLPHIVAGEQAQDGAVGAQGQSGQTEKGNESVDQRQGHGHQVIHQQGKKLNIAAFIRHAGLPEHLGIIGDDGIGRVGESRLKAKPSTTIPAKAQPAVNTGPLSSRR